MYEHVHCAVDGCILNGVGGGGDDGRELIGYEDQHGGGAEDCATCDSLVAPACAKRTGRQIGKKLYCAECFSDLVDKAQEASILVGNLSDALNDVCGSRKRLACEDSPAYLEAADAVLRELEREVFDYRVALSAKLTQALSRTLPGIAA
jgi:hypothetical protein